MSAKATPGIVAAPPPAPMESSIVRRTAADLLGEFQIRRRSAFPAGSHRPSARNTWRTLADPLGLLLEHRERFGSVFTVRTLHMPVIWVTGAPGAHQMLVTDADAFSWRDGSFRDLHPLLGDGMLNIDGAYHRELRQLMLPAFHREQVAQAADEMVAEAVDAADHRLVVGQRVEMYEWTRELALRIAMRSLLGLEAGAGREAHLAAAFSTALHFYGRSHALQLLRGPGSPYAHAQRGRMELDALIAEEITERRRAGTDGKGLLGMLLGARNAAGDPLPVQAVRDQAVTILFAGHDTTTATVAFMLRELARTPDALQALTAELDAVLGGRTPTAADLTGARLPVLERTLKETLRRYPPAWVGPRRAIRDVEIDGTSIPVGSLVHYSSWVNHHIADYFPDPLAFRPDRFLPEAEKALPKGAYIPFGGGSRMCLGKRFGEFEIRAIIAVLLQRFHFEADPSVALKITTTPTLGPANGLWFTTRTAGASR